MKIKIIGAGISGLTTAVLLSMRGHSMSIAAQDMPLASPSMIAGAIWHPFFQEPDELYFRRARNTYETLVAYAGDLESGILPRTLTEFVTPSDGSLWWTRGMSAVRDITSSKCIGDGSCAFEVPVFVADTPRYLAYLTNLFIELGGRLERSYIQNLEEQTDYFDFIINCSGYGASSLCNDCAIDLVRGVVVEIEKSSNFSGCFIDDRIAHRPTYVIERDTDCILGGTAETGFTGTLVDPKVVEDIVKRCEEMAPGISGARIKRTNVGFRPRRREVCLGFDTNNPKILHNYGHGGSGFTLSWGCANEIAQLIESH
ncbi:D-amino-acid oxidase [Candidatus Burkholderia humilis]|nr:D-amino-acid oxidase [Candidatus Burkholderia humilis]